MPFGRPRLSWSPSIPNPLAIEVSEPQQAIATTAACPLCSLSAYSAQPFNPPLRSSPHHRNRSNGTLQCHNLAWNIPPRGTHPRNALLPSPRHPWDGFPFTPRLRGLLSLPPDGHRRPKPALCYHPQSTCTAWTWTPRPSSTPPFPAQRFYSARCFTSLPHASRRSPCVQHHSTKRRSAN